MVRMIDADALRAELQNEIDKATPPFNDTIGSIRCGVRLARNIVEDQPTVDAVPVIRCKDCKHYYEKEWVVGGGSYTTCWYQTIANAQPNDFCSRAERK